MPTKHLVHFGSANFTKTGARLFHQTVEAVCGETLKRVEPTSFFHDDPTACAACLKEAPNVPSPKYPMIDSIHHE